MLKLNPSTEETETAAVGSRPTPFRKRLRWHIENPPKDSFRWKITPAMAEEMLAWNDRNRPVTSRKVIEYATMMRSGRWHYTGEPIIFSPVRLIDGQHRLLGCVEAKTDFEALVVFGAPDDAFSYIDVGKPRSASDVFAINGVKNWALMAATIEWIIHYENGTMGSAQRAKERMDHAQKYAIYQQNTDLQESAWVGHLFAQARLCSPSMMTAFHYICAKKSRRAADEFFRQLADGVGFTSKASPIYQLRKKLIDARSTGVHLGKTTAAAIVIKTWNACRLGRGAGKLQFGADETFPTVV